MRQETQYNVTVLLPSSDPEVLKLLGYAIKSGPPKQIVVRCSRFPSYYHEAALNFREVQFELEHEPTPEELVEFQDLETRVPVWAAALAEKLVALTREGNNATN